MQTVSVHPTPYAVLCRVHGRVFLTHDEYQRQMQRAGDVWRCPLNHCGRAAEWDDDNYDRHVYGETA